MHSLTAGFLLTKLNAGLTRFTFSELSELEDDSSYYAQREIDRLLKQGFVRRTGEEEYVIAADIYTIRKAAIACAEQPARPENEAARFSRNDITEGVWRITNEALYYPDEDSPTDVAESPESFTEFMAKRRRELIARLAEDVERQSGGKKSGKKGKKGKSSPDDKSRSEEKDSAQASSPKDDTSPAEWARRHQANGDELAEKLVRMLSSDRAVDRDMAAVLKLCAKRGYVTPLLAHQTLNMFEESSRFICFLLSYNGYIRREDGEEDKFVLNFPEELLKECSVRATAFVIDGADGKKSRRKERETGFFGRIYPIRVREIVRRSLTDMVKDDPEVTRQQAIEKGKDLLCISKAAKLEDEVSACKIIIKELNNMSDFMFEMLKKQL